MSGLDMDRFRPELSVARENRSPSRMYEESLIMERKIRNLGLFSENVGWSFSAMLDDSQEIKNIVKVGFKEIERELQEMDEGVKEEKQARVKEISELRGLMEVKLEGLEDSLTRLHKDIGEVISDKMSYMNLQCQQRDDSLRSEFEKMLEEKWLQKNADLDAKMENIEQQILDNTIGTDRKLKAMEAKSRELTQAALTEIQKINQEEREKMLWISRTAAEDMQAKNENQITQLDDLKNSLLQEQEKEKEKRREEARHMQVVLDQNKKEAETFRAQLQTKLEGVDECLQGLTDGQNKLTTTLQGHNQDIQGRIDRIKAKLEDKIEAKSKDLKGLIQENNQNLGTKLEEQNRARLEMGCKTETNLDALKEELTKAQLRQKKDREELYEKLGTNSEEITNSMQSLEERLNAQLQEADHSIEIKNSIIRE